MVQTLGKLGDLISGGIVYISGEISGAPLVRSGLDMFEARRQTMREKVTKNRTHDSGTQEKDDQAHSRNG